MKLKLVAAIAGGSLITGVVLTQWLANASLRRTNAELVATNNTLTTAAEWNQNVINQLDADLEMAHKRSNALAAQVAEISQSQTEANATLTKAKGRLSNAALKKTALIQRRINDAVRRLMLSFACASGGDSTDCD